MGFLFRNIAYPMWHGVKGDGINRAIKELKRNQWLPSPDLLALQQRKLASLLNFAGKHTPYYREFLHDSGTKSECAIPMEDFQKIPVLTKSIVRRNDKAMVSETIAANGLLSNSTSGSTGEVFHFYTDQRSNAFRNASVIRSDSYTGWRVGDRVVRLWGAPIDEKLTVSLRGKLHGWVTGNKFLSSFDLSTRRMDEFIKAIQTFRPTLLVAYPGPLAEFAMHCRERRVTFPTLKAIVSSAESLWDHQREAIEDAFTVKVFDRYGSREVGQIASECEAHDGLHISTDRVLIEVVDDEAKSCGPGEEGRILVTDLDNYGMPLIRYDIGDRGVLAEDLVCSCGRGLPKIQTIEGRTLDVVRTSDGRSIGGTFWTLLLRSRDGFSHFQVIQHTVHGVDINYVKGANFDDDALSYFTEKIREHCGDDFGVSFEEKKSIGLTGSGKRRIIISHILSGDNNRGSAKE